MQGVRGAFVAGCPHHATGGRSGGRPNSLWSRDADTPRGTVGAMGIDRTIPNITVPDRVALETSVREPRRLLLLTTVDEVQTVLGRVVEQGLEVVHLLSEEPWGVTRFFYRDSAGTVINVGSHT